jgi:hypothetical protein
LILHLKRFNIFGKKINKHIAYGETLDLSPYMSTETRIDAKYRLCGVLVHSGNSCHSGHYYSYVKNSNDIWYRMDDSRVSQVPLKQALDQHAYILFYVREGQYVEPETPKFEEPPTPLKTPTKPNEVFEEIIRKERETASMPPPPSPMIKKNLTVQTAPTENETSPKTPPSTEKKNKEKGPLTPTTPLSVLLEKKKRAKKIYSATCSSPLKPAFVSGTSGSTSPFSHAKILKHMLKQQRQVEEAVEPPPTPVIEKTPSESSQGSKSPVKLDFDPKAYSRETHSSTMGQQIEAWDAMAEASQKAALESLVKEENKNKRKRALWDQEMDKGKVKKVRIKETVDNWENRSRSFQYAHEMKLEKEKFELEKRAEEEKYM